MKRPSIRCTLASLLALGLLGPCAGLHAAEWLDLRGAAPIHGDASAGAAKAALCAACHGPNGNSIVPAFPRLAGQRIDYLYWQLVNFKRGAQPQSPMTPLAANLGDSDMRDLAAYFAEQLPSAAAAPAAPAADRGEQLFRHGDSAQGIPPCQGCHGVDGGGIDDPRFRTWPVLRGQHADYVAARLKAFRAGTLSDSSNAFIMRGVALSLDDAAISDLAAWIGSLPPAPAR